MSTPNLKRNRLMMINCRPAHKAKHSTADFKLLTARQTVDAISPARYTDKKEMCVDKNRLAAY